MKKTNTKLILSTLILSLTCISCGFGNTASPSAETQDNAAAEPVSLIRIDEASSTVELTIPENYMESATQEELDTAAKEMGIQSITLQEDGSALYVMTMEQHEKMLSDIRENIMASLETMKQSNDYKNFINITTNENFTEFTVTTTEKRLDTKESFSVMSFYMYGEMYNMFLGTPADNIHVEFIHAETGELVSAADSSNSKY